MNRFKACITAISLAMGASLAGPAFSAETKGADKVGQYVDLSPVGLPVISQGRMVNYVFVTLRVTLSPRADSTKLRSKEPYFRDALVRLSYRSPFSRPDDLNKLDDAALKTKMLAEAVLIAGPGAVTGIEVLKETPRRYLPRPAATGKKADPAIHIGLPPAI